MTGTDFQSTLGFWTCIFAPVSVTVANISATWCKPFHTSQDIIIFYCFLILIYLFIYLFMLSALISKFLGIIYNLKLGRIIQWASWAPGQWSMRSWRPIQEANISSWNYIKTYSFLFLFFSWYHNSDIIGNLPFLSCTAEASGLSQSQLASRYGTATVQNKGNRPDGKT